MFKPLDICPFVHTSLTYKSLTSTDFLHYLQHEESTLAEVLTAWVWHPYNPHFHIEKDSI